VNLKPTGQAAPMLIAGGVFVAVWIVCFALVRKDAEEKWAVGMDARHEFKFAGTCAIFAAGAAYALARRLERGGPQLSRDEWTLHAADFGAGQIANLQRGLERHGYVISVIGLSEAGEPAKAVVPTQPLAGARLGIRDRRHPFPDASLSLLLPAPPAAGARPGFGMLTVVDQDPHEGTYAEMAQYLVAALSEVMPGLRFKRLSSGLAADPADVLRTKLPPSPRHLPKESISSNRR
jgi:hypothetical protein